MRITSKWQFKEFLNKKGVFSYELADALGVTESAVSKRLRNAGEKEFSELAAVVEKLARKKAG